MVARMRARQSATSLLGAQARAGVRPEAETEKRETEKRGRDKNRRGAGRAHRGSRGGKAETDKGGMEQHSISLRLVCKQKHLHGDHTPHRDNHIATKTRKYIQNKTMYGTEQAIKTALQLNQDFHCSTLYCVC